MLLSLFLVQPILATYCDFETEKCDNQNDTVNYGQGECTAIRLLRASSSDLYFLENNFHLALQRILIKARSSLNDGLT